MVTVIWQAHWFDGRTSEVHQASVSIDGPAIAISAGTSPDAIFESASRVEIERLTIGEWFRGAPQMLGLPDGSSLQIEDEDGSFDSALRRGGYRPGRVYGLMQRWSSAAACALALVALLVWMNLQGAQLLATAAVRVLPTSIDKRIGRTALAIADAQWLAPSLEPDRRQADLRARFTELVRAQYPGLEFRLEFRSTRNRQNSFNAFALPDGTIVLLDGLVLSMTDDEVIAVLGHELGHVVHRDVMRTLARQIGLLAVADVVWGGISGAAATTAAALQGLHFSRDVEREADTFALRFLERSGLSARSMADAFGVMEEEEKRTGEPSPFLSDHPSTHERRQSVESSARSSPQRSLAGVTLGITAEQLRRAYGPPLRTVAPDHWIYDSIAEAHHGLIDVYFTAGDAENSRRIVSVLFTPGAGGSPREMPDFYGQSREELVRRFGEPVQEKPGADPQYITFRDGVIVYVSAGKVRAYGVRAEP